MSPHLSRNQFNTLDTSLQSILVQFHGVNLKALYYKGHYKVVLYTLFDFYVEVYYSKMTGQVCKIETFTSYKRLDPFLPSIDINCIDALLRIK